MFLEKLSSENQSSFLQLAYCAIMSDSDLAVQRKKILSDYCREMGLPGAYPAEPINVDSVIAKMAVDTSVMEKNIIIIELIALVCKDGIYDQREQNFVKKVADAFNINSDKLHKIKDLLDDYSMIFKGLNKLIVE
jgi:hypothetical protein